MAEIGFKRWRIITVTVISLVTASMLASADRTLLKEDLAASAAVNVDGDLQNGSFVKFASSLFQTSGSGYEHVWPEMELGWKIVLGSFIGFCGAIFGSAAGVGGGGIFVPMLTLIIGFDPKSATGISKCMIMGASTMTVFYNLKLRHPTLDMPIIDYDLALLIQPMLMLGISIGVSLNVIFADWMVTVLLIIIFTVTSTKAFCKGVATWKKETITKKCAYFKNGLLPFQEAAKCLESNGYSVEVDYKLLPSGPNNGSETKAEESLKQEVDLMKNVCWKEFGLLVFVWIAFLGLQIFKTYTTTCSIWYWVLNLLQVPVSFGVSGYEAVSLYKGSRKISSKGDSNSKLRVGQLIIYCFCGILAGMVGGLLGLGGGLIMGPLFLELGIPPQVSSATATFAMMFSSSMSSVEYYLLKRFPVPYAFYFVVVVTIAASAGQHFVRRLIIFLGRTSLIIFILASIIFISAISLGGVGISNMINDIHRHEYMGFENMCKIEV
ncbi:sulfite exporter TauE/SafE family protein 3 isoform X1 [Lactuca sativa]|uniref:sulfite exporter TauE/SafE family protein 3 isoform X1 n=1 Tax=Lactuca sativa TaxID=4236 RepID=UPI0022AE6F28|nr:sulfite exporter TauE/SafE family protein 3 isoform X1 [Lactuca sativa]